MNNLLPGASPILDGIVGLHCNQLAIFIIRPRGIWQGSNLRRRTDSAHLAAVDHGGVASSFYVEAFIRLEGVAFAKNGLPLFIHLRHFCRSC